jgi:hypothetical protein
MIQGCTGSLTFYSQNHAVGGNRSFVFVKRIPIFTEIKRSFFKAIMGLHSQHNGIVKLEKQWKHK